MSQMNIEKEITTQTLLCDSDGKLNSDSVGWARKPLITSNLKGHLFRKKKWNYWCVYGKDALFSATISHLDYAASCFVYYLDFETNEFFEKTILLPLGKNVSMSDDVYGNATAVNKEMGIFFIWDGKHILLKVSATNFGGKPLVADLKITCDEKIDSLNVVVPWSEDKFQYTSKQHCLPVEGSFSVGDKEYHFEKDRDFAVLDYGRGDWPRNITWNWGMASGWQGEDAIGLNFGGKWTDGTGVTENGIILNGKLFKIQEPVDFIYDRKNWMNPWRIKSMVTDNVDITFTPTHHRIAASNVVLVKSEVHQMVGHYSGKVILDDGKEIVIEKLRGTIEEHIAKW